MPDEGVKVRVSRVVEGAYNQGCLDGLDQLYAAGILYHRPPLPDIEGLSEFRQHIADICTAFSDIQYRTHGTILEGDAQAYRWAFRGTHTGRSPSIPIPPTDRRAAIVGCSVSRWRQGQIIEEWNYLDWLGLFRQLGVIPPIGLQQAGDPG